MKEKKPNLSSKNDMGILKGIVSRRDIRESNETETSRDSGGAVKRDC